MANYMPEANSKNENMKINLYKHVIYNMLRNLNKDYRREFGKMVICSDSKSYWRKKEFPHYKASREKNREKSKFDWDLVFKIIDSTREDLIKHFPYNFLRINTCEADDIIATLCFKNPHEKTIIISADQDFCQLQSNPNISQYDPVKKKKIDSEGLPIELYLREHIVRGDSGDGIPSILSHDAIFVTEPRVRQSPIKKAFIEKFMNLVEHPYDICENEEMLERYKRNELLIDLRKIPENIQNMIINTYEEFSTENNRNTIMNYFIQNDFRNLIEDLEDF